MASAGTLSVNVVANTAQFTRAMQGARAQLRGFSRTITGIVPQLAGLFSAAAVGAGFGFAGRLAAEAETAEVAFETMLGSAARAREMLEKLEEFSASTPFQFNNLTAGARKLLAFGVAAGDVMDHMQVLGDIAAGSGSRIEELVTIFGKARSSGVVALGDLNQLGDRGIPIFETLKAQLGLSGSELRKFVSTGQLHFPALLQALQSMTAEGGLFADAMEKQSKTLAGTLSTLKDEVFKLFREVGKKLLPILKETVTWVLELTKWVKGLSFSTIKSTAKVMAFAAAFAVGAKFLPRVITAIRTMTAAIKAQGVVTAIASAIAGNWIGLLGGLVAGGVAAYAVNEMLDSFGESAVEAADDVGELGDGIKKLETLEGPSKAVENMERLIDLGKQVTREVRTPAEIYMDRINELHELLGANAISLETFHRATKKALDTLRSDTGSAKPSDSGAKEMAALARGTTAEFVERIRLQRNLADAPAKRTADATEKSEKHLAAIKGGISIIASGLGTQPVIVDAGL